MSEVRRREYEAYVWRLAMLLTDDPVGAEWILDSMLRSQPDLLRLGESRRDRMTVLRAREWERGAADRRTRRERERVVKRAGSVAGESPRERFAGEAAQLWVAARGLERQPFEAWLLLDVVGMTELDASRSLDCSRRALANHVEAARGALSPLFAGELERARRRLLAAVQEWDAEPALAMARERRRVVQKRRRVTLVIWMVVLLAIMGVLIWTVVDVFRTTDRKETFRDRIRGEEPLNLVE